METIKHVRRNSKNVLPDLGYKSGERDTPIPAPTGGEAKMIRSIASLIRGKSKLLLLESPDMVEVYKLDKPVPGNEHMYLPGLTPKPSNLKSMRGALTQSCPYLYDKRRGSFSSVGSQRTGHVTKKQSKLKAQKEAKKSNVTVTMTYLGHGRRDAALASRQDELRVLQQANGGENVCVFTGLVAPGERFQFVSQRQRGFPFSLTVSVGGLTVARISSCCEYRYSPGFQQGKKSCFRLAWLAGGMPCYRCTALRNKYGSCQQLNNDGTKENSSLQFHQSPGRGIVESCPSSPLFIPAAKQPEKKTARARRETKANKEGGGHQSTDSEDPPAVSGFIKDTSKTPKRRPKGHSTRKRTKGKTSEVYGEEGQQDSKRAEEKPHSSEDMTAGDSDDKISAKQTHKQQTTTTTNKQTTNKQQPEQQKPSCNVKTPQADHRDMNKTVPDSLHDHQEVVSQQNGTKQKADLRGSNGRTRAGERLLKDFYEECVEMSTEVLEPGPNKHNRFKDNILERCRLHKKLSKHPNNNHNATSSDVEASEESAGPPDDEEEEQEEEEEAVEEQEEEPVEEPDLQAQLDAMMTVLNMSDEVGELVLRNTDLTDDLLLSLATALKSSMSQVTLLNLNLNQVGPYGAIVLLDLIRAKPSISGLLLFGNRLRDHGIQSLINGIAELQEQTRMAALQQQALMLEEAMYYQQQQQQQAPDLLGDPFAALGAMGAFETFALVELDIGGNGLSSDGLKVLASFMRDHSYLQYLGLAQTSGADLAAWKELFHSMKGNRSLTHIILDQSNLGDPGVRLLGDMLEVNVSLTHVDLDGNGVSDVGGNDLMGALLCRGASFLPLRHLSLQDNDISAGLMVRLREELRKD